jgi:hypothetical protein
MADRRGPAGLHREAFAERGLGLGAQHLHRHVAVEPFIAGAPDLGGPAPIDPLGQAIAACQEATRVVIGCGAHPFFDGNSDAVR